MEYTKKYHSGSAPEKKYADSLIPSSSAQVPNSILCDVMAGKKRATSEMMGHRANLSASVAAKMNRAFGMDFSNVQLYRSDVMSGTGTEGLAQGNKIVLSKDIDLNTLSGQAVLGHELSHLRAQSLGIGMGHSGLYNNASLEHQADTEGMMAARGLSLNGSSLGMETAPGMQGFSSLTPLGAGMGPSAGAPMQAKGKKEKQKDGDETSGGKKFFGGLLGGAGRALQGVGAGLNLATGGHLFGSLYNKLSWKGGAGQAIGKALLAPISMITNLPSTIIGSAGALLHGAGSKLWNSGWNKNKGDNTEGPLIHNQDDVQHDNVKTVDWMFAGGTNLSNRFINPGQSSRESWISEIAKRNHSKLTGRNVNTNTNLQSDYSDDDSEALADEIQDNFNNPNESGDEKQPILPDLDDIQA